MENKQYGPMARKAIEDVARALNELPKGFSGRAILLFSGGRDSTAVAAAFCHAFPQSQLYLLFLDNGLLSRVRSPERQAAHIKSIFSSTDVQFHMRRVSQIMRIAGMQQIEKDFKEHGFSTLLICVACKLVMNFAAIRFAKEIGVDIIMDGYAERQSGFPEQTEIFMSFARDLFQKNGLFYSSPLYSFLSDKEKVNHTIRELGVSILKQEAVCMWSDAFSVAKEEEIKKYLYKTTEIIQNFDMVLRPGDIQEPNI
ncbi:MAG: 7-cyano-7-deazaguanine synthase [Patescibacteria group bacterium]|nr:7-cyano-7-deazaguanine synthase [Patescibacteria group bacterium]